MDKRHVEHYRKLLLVKEEEFSHLVSRAEEDGRTNDGEEAQDVVDKAANSYAKEFLFHQSDDYRRNLQLISEALERIKSGGYGKCIACESEIQPKRLEACLGLATASSARRNKKRDFSNAVLARRKRGASSPRCQSPQPDLPCSAKSLIVCLA